MVANLLVSAAPPTKCTPGLIPGLNVICGLSLLLVLFLSFYERIFSGYSDFPVHSKPIFSKFQFDPESDPRARGLLNLRLLSVTLAKQRRFICFSFFLSSNHFSKNENLGEFVQIHAVWLMFCFRVSGT